MGSTSSPPEAPVCLTCGNQAGPPGPPPAVCPICADERQYVRDDGWTTVSGLIAAGHRNDWRRLEDALYGFRAQPAVGIGPRSLLLVTAAGNVLFDVNPLPDEETVERIRGLGGLAAISASHPHFYGAMCDWSAALGGVPILLPEADRQWALRQDAPIEWWSGEREVVPGVTLVQCGGHFAGSSILHWADGAGGRGVLFTGDTVMVTPDAPWMSFMHSYPNLIPLPAVKARAIADRALALRFDRIYGNPGWEKHVAEGAHAALRRSIERYERALAG